MLAAMSWRMAIRPYRRSDRDPLLAVWLDAARLAHGFLGEAVLQGQLLLIRDFYLGRAETLIAEADGRLLGGIGLVGHFIAGLCVDPACQRRGVGGALVEAAARLRGTLTVDVYLANKPALAFYERQGFREIDRRPKPGEGCLLPLIRMRRLADGLGAKPRRMREAG